MKCKKCKEQAIHGETGFCQKHFVDYFENKVLDTINKYKLILNKKEKICVAASGGKDSVALLYILHKFSYNIEALAIDEGIVGYRDKSLEFLKKICKNKNIPLVIKSYKREVGKTVDQLSKKYSPACNVCGTFRRYLLDKYSKDYKKIATGHNLDDEAQAVLMNILKAQTSLFSRQGPITKEIKGFTQKIKPFYFMKEKEIMIYAVINELNVDFEECPYAPESFRAHVRDLLNEEESQKLGVKLNIVNHYLKLKKEIQSDEFVEQENASIKKCNICQSPCSGLICKACKLKDEIKSL